MVGEGARVLIERAFAGELAPGSEEIERAFWRYLDHYREVFLDTTQLFPGLAPLLDRLAAAYPLALLSNKGEFLSRDLLAGLGVADRFRAILGGDSLATRKPHPGGLQQIAHLLELPVAELLLIGDTWVDAETARAAGCRLALVEWGFPHPPGFAEIPADLRIAHADELAAALLP
jgi:phosphoglycolate phosphatase